MISHSLFPVCSVLPVVNPLHAIEICSRCRERNKGEPRTIHNSLKTKGESKSRSRCGYANFVNFANLKIFATRLIFASRH